jgi:SpoVK/Ycf46/Vps4 family AAA+-type ATPase
MSDLKAQVISALEAAIAQSPQNYELRTHLAELLIAANRPDDALQHASAVLQDVPDHIGALTAAMQAATLIGNADRAQRYTRLLQVLQIPPAELIPAETPAQSPQKVRETDQPVSDDDADTAPADDEIARTTPPKVVPLRVVQGGIAEEAWRIEQTDVKLKDVAGLDAVKRRLELSIFALLRHAEMRDYYGRSIRGGLLLYGPPGCGKTFVARATAGELGARFLAIGLSDVLDMYLGQSERKLHELFETARRSAPCVIFIDEIDALGRKRSLQRASSERNLVNQLLSEMDSIAANNQGVFILAATNHLWDVDTALRRPGRFDRVIFVGPPDADARRAILEYHMRDRTSESIDWSLISGKTEGFSGADLAHVCDTAAEHAMEDSMRSGKVRPIQWRDFQGALKEVKPSTRPWLETARDYAMFANEGGTYDDLLEYLRTVRML